MYLRAVVSEDGVGDLKYSVLISEGVVCPLSRTSEKIYPVVETVLGSAECNSDIGQGTACSSDSVTYFCNLCSHELSRYIFVFLYQSVTFVPVLTYVFC